MTRRLARKVGVADCMPTSEISSATAACPPTASIAQRTKGAVWNAPGETVLIAGVVVGKPVTGTNGDWIS